MRDVPHKCKCMHDVYGGNSITSFNINISIQMYIHDSTESIRKMLQGFLSKFDQDPLEINLIFQSSTMYQYDLTSNSQKTGMSA